MDYLALPPEINSARMYSGPGSGPLMAAATAWQGLAAELQSTAASYSSAISALTTQAWQGPASASMAAAAAPYVAWMRSTAAQAEQAGAQALAAASAYEVAFAMTVPPPVVAANRTQLMALIATNILGQNTPAIAATEAQYSEMWAQDVAAMENYSTSSAAASNLSPFTSPPTTTNPAAAATQAAAAPSNAAGVAGQAAAASTGAAAAAPAAPTPITTLTFPGLYGEESSLNLLDFIQAGNLAQSIPNTSASMANVGRQFDRDAIADAKDAAKGEAKPAATGPGGLGADLRPAGAAVEPGAGRGGATVTASVGQGPSISGLSVPQSWTTSPEVRQLAKVLSTNGAQAAPVVMAEDAESPYTGMALASLIGSGMGGLAGRGGSAVNIPTPAPAGTKPAAKKATMPGAAIPAIPVANTPLSTENAAAQLAAALAAMPGATIVVIPPKPAGE